MANDLTASRPELWSKRMQRAQHKVPVYQALANLEEREAVQFGDTVHRPYRNILGVNTLGSDGSYTVQDITDTDETMTIDQRKESTFTVQDDDALFNKYDNLSKLGSERADDQSTVLQNYIDGTFLKNMSDAAVGSMTAVTLSTSNVMAQFFEAEQKLGEQSNSATLKGKRAWAVLSPAYINILSQALSNRLTTMGDKVTENGYFGSVNNFDIYRSMSLPTSHVLALATNPTNGDTVTYDGQVFTFVSSIGTTAGNVLIGASADATRANLAALINDPGTTTANGVALSSTQPNYYTPSPLTRFKGYVSASNDNTANTLTITKIGGNRVAVSETLTDGTDTWTAASQLQYNLFGFGKPTDMVMKRSPNVEIKDVSGKLAKDIVAWTVYGMKTFAEGATHIVKAPIRTDAM